MYERITYNATGPTWEEFNSMALTQAKQLTAYESTVTVSHTNFQYPIMQTGCIAAYYVSDINLTDGSKYKPTTHTKSDFISKSRGNDNTTKVSWILIENSTYDHAHFAFIKDVQDAGTINKVPALNGSGAPASDGEQFHVYHYFRASHSGLVYERMIYNTIYIIGPTWEMFNSMSLTPAKQLIESSSRVTVSHNINFQYPIINYADNYTHTADRSWSELYHAEII